MGEKDYELFINDWTGKEELKSYKFWLTAVEGVLDTETKAYFRWRSVLLVATENGCYQYDDCRVCNGETYNSIDEALAEARMWEITLKDDQWYNKKTLHMLIFKT